VTNNREHRFWILWVICLLETTDKMAKKMVDEDM
jgi:hypothetical protein